MNGKERIIRILNRQPVDRIGVFEHFWPETYEEWTNQGHLQPNENWDDHFNLDMSIYWAFNLTADLDFKPEVLAETAETITTKDGNGAILRRHKLHSSTPEHVGFTVTDRESWEVLKPLLTPDPRRINFEAYREEKEKAAKAGRFFAWSGVNVFECMHPVCGHENMLMGMALDPDWILDMTNTYAELIIELQKMLFEKEGYPDGIWYYEDMGFKERPFMSPAMYVDLIQPGHKKTIDFAHSHNLPVIMHSCGFIEPLLPHMIDAGIDCLQAMEIKAGMDLLHIHKAYGDKIALMGGIDIRTLFSGDFKDIDVELEAKLPFVKEGFNYILHSDHSIPPNISYETFKYFIKKGLELGTYTQCHI